MKQTSLDGPPILSWRVANQNRSGGSLILNADDWGRDRATTDRILICHKYRSISSVSAMVFMADSIRSAGLAHEREIDAGLHLNFTTPFTSCNIPRRLQEQQRSLAEWLFRGRLAQALYNPMLRQAFQDVTSAQLDEFLRLYGEMPGRVDGHHHMHLCANVLWSGILPSGTTVRRNFSFWAGEKSAANRFYRKLSDHILGRRYRMADFFFSLLPLKPQARLSRILALAGQFTVEIETHPVNQEEFQFLAGPDVFHWCGDQRIAPNYTLRHKDHA